MNYYYYFYVVDAAEHAKEAQGLREKADKQIQEAIEDHENNQPHEDARCVIIGDYCQNCGIPHVGTHQPGDTYYYSPLKCYVFGIVDCCVPGGELHAYPYHEVMGDKGGNNVASFFMMVYIVRI